MWLASPLAAARDDSGSRVTMFRQSESPGPTSELLRCREGLFLKEVMVRGGKRERRKKERKKKMSKKWPSLATWQLRGNFWWGGEREREGKEKGEVDAPHWRFGI